MTVNSGVIPLAVLSVGLVIGGILAVYITRKTARIRLLRQIMLAQQEALAEEQFLKQKPTLTDVYIGPPPIQPSKPCPGTSYSSPWLDIQVSNIARILHGRTVLTLAFCSQSLWQSIRLSRVHTRTVLSRRNRDTHTTRLWTEMLSTSLSELQCHRRL